MRLKLYTRLLSDSMTVGVEVCLPVCGPLHIMETFSLLSTPPSSVTVHVIPRLVPAYRGPERLGETDTPGAGTGGETERVTRTLIYTTQEKMRDLLGTSISEASDVSLAPKVTKGSLVVKLRVHV